jgi:hypothetical protein
MLQITSREPKKYFETHLRQKPAYINKAAVIFLISCITLLSIVPLKANAQLKGPINYFIPKVITFKIIDYLKAAKPNDHYYAILQNQNDTTSILISSYDRSFTKLIYLIANTNRFIKISPNVMLPLLLHSDLLFSDLLHSVRNEGKENEIISHTDVNSGGYSIIYRGGHQNETIIKTEYIQY